MRTTSVLTFQGFSGVIVCTTKSGACGGSKRGREKGLTLTFESRANSDEASHGPLKGLTYGKVAPNVRRKSASSPRSSPIEVIREVSL